MINWLWEMPRRCQFRVHLGQCNVPQMFVLGLRRLVGMAVCKTPGRSRLERAAPSTEHMGCALDHLRSPQPTLRAAIVP